MTTTATATDLATAWRAFAAACAAFSPDCEIVLERDQQGIRVAVYLSQEEYRLDLAVIDEFFSIEQMPPFCDGPFLLWQDGQELMSDRKTTDPYTMVGDIFTEIAEREPHADLTVIRGSETIRLEMRLETDPFTFDLPAMLGTLRRRGLPTSLEYNCEDGLVILSRPL